MKATHMAAETGAGVAFSLKSGLLGGFILLAASVLGTVIGFKVVPPTKGKEMDDISTRLAGQHQHGRTDKAVSPTP